MEFRLRPARDLGLAPGARLRSLSREPGLLGLAMQAAWRRCVRAYLRLAHRMAIEGAENLPPPPFVLVANHTSHLDALVLMAALRGAAARRAHALAAGELFFGSTAAAAFSAYALSALPVWRGRTGRHALATLRARLVEDGLVYVLFPEGTRARDGAMKPFQPGLGALVCATTVPVVPALITGAFEAWPASRRWPRWGQVRVTIGRPFLCTELADTPQGWGEAAARAQQAVRALVPLPLQDGVGEGGGAARQTAGFAPAPPHPGPGRVPNPPPQGRREP
jgi:1-acyl-sn-glycerol-3-phosphate acyltransferase